MSWNALDLTSLPEVLQICQFKTMNAGAALGYRLSVRLAVLDVYSDSNGSGNFLEDIELQVSPHSRGQMYAHKGHQPGCNMIYIARERR